MLIYRRLWQAVGGLLILLVIYLSLTPQPPGVVSFENADKVEHALAYSVLSFWLCLIYWTATSRVLLMLALAGLGVALEYVQGWTGYRSFDVMDMLADSAGVLAGRLLVPTRLGRLLVYTENYLKVRKLRP